MKRQSLYFDGPYQVSVREEPIAQPGPKQLLVQTLVSAISGGTERLIYQGRVPSDMRIDDTIESLGNQSFQFPLKYGYATVGKVIAVGEALEDAWQDTVVFAFNPHESHFISAPEALIPLDIDPEDAVFLPNMETAVSFVMDAAPMIGEQTAVFGQGVVGLLTTMLLAHYPLSSLVTVDPCPIRRKRSMELGATASLDPTDVNGIEQALSSLQGSRSYAGADLTFELSGNPSALQQGISVTGFDGRILLGSWYGQKKAELNLGGDFHRSQIQIISSQVSHLASRLRGRWTKSRRMEVALSHLKKHRPSSLITHRFPLSQAAEAYQLLSQSNDQSSDQSNDQSNDQPNDQPLQIIFTY